MPFLRSPFLYRQVLRALAHCHSQGIIHRNLKPKYILLNEKVLLLRGHSKHSLLTEQLSSQTLLHAECDMHSLILNYVATVIESLQLSIVAALPPFAPLTMTV